MGLKKSKFTADTTIPAGSTFDFVSNGQNFKIPVEDLLTALGVTGTLTQEGAVSGTPVLDPDGDNYKIRNIENGPGILSSVSAENGLEVRHNFSSGDNGKPILDDIDDASPLIRSLLAGDNVSIVEDGNGLRISAAFGTLANTVNVQEKADFPAPVLGVIQLESAAYIIVDKIDLGTDVLAMGEGTLIQGYTAEVSQLTTNSASPLISAVNLSFEAAAVKGGLEINNTGSGAVARVEGTSIVFFEQLLSLDSGSKVLEIHNCSGGVAVDRWTAANGVDGIVLTGTGNTGPIITDFNPSGLTGKGIDIQGDISSGSLRINTALITVGGNAIDISGDIQGLYISGDAISTVSGNGLKISGNVDGGALLEATNILSYTQEGMDITGSTIQSLIGSAAGINSIAAGKSAMKGNAESDTSILPNGGNIPLGFSAIFSVCSIDNPLDPTADPLSGITKKDLSYDFQQAGARITDSTGVGGVTLDAQATTTISFIGEDGTITGFSDPGGGVNTTVLTGATPASGAPVAITGTTSYNGLFTAANVVGGVSFDIVRTFVANDGAAIWQSGWTKIAGTTSDIATTERFLSSGNNEIESLDHKTIPVLYQALISGEKTGAGQDICQLALFVDMNNGDGFVHIDGAPSFEADNRIRTNAIIVPTEMCEGSKASLYIRNTEATNDWVSESFSVSITKS